MNTDACTRSALLRGTYLSAAVVIALTALPVAAQTTPDAGGEDTPVITPPERPETPTRPFDVIVSSGDFNGGLNDILRFNGTTGEFVGSFADIETVPDIPGMPGTPLLNDPRDVVLTGDPFDPATQVLINTGFVPPMEGNDLTLAFDIEGNFVGTFAELGDSGFFVDPGGAVFGPGDDFFVGSRTEGTVFQYDGETGAFVPTDFIDGGGYFDPADIDFPRGFVFDAEGNLYIGNGANPVTGEGQNAILLVDPVTRELTTFSAPADFSPLDVILSPDGTKLVVSSESPFTGGSLAAAGPGSIFIFDLASGEVEQVLSPQNADGSPAILAPRGLGFAPDGTLFASSTGNGSIFRFDIETGEFLGSFAQIFTFDADGNVTGNINGQALNFIGVFAACGEVGATITCGRGIDFGGISNAGDDLIVDLLDGAFIENTLDLGGGGNSVTIAQGATISVLDSAAIALGGDAVVTNAGFLESENNDGIRLGAGSALGNSGTIVSNGGDAVAAGGADNVTITNGGMIFSAEEGGSGIAAGAGLALQNSGSVTSLASSAVKFDSGSVSNLADGLIIGEIGIAGTDGGDAQLVFNAGTIAGMDGTAVSLGSGADLFEQQAGGLVSGSVDLGGGDDTFRLLGAASSISGGVSGGSGTDLAELSGTVDADNLTSFENIDVVDARFVGARSLAGDTTISGGATFDLGSDSLAIDGDLMLADGAMITVLTSQSGLVLLDGGPITLITETGAFANEGASVVVEDDDFLVDYETSFGSVMITPVAATFTSASDDPNFTAFGPALTTAVAAGAIEPTLAAQINALGGSANIDDVAPALLPALNGGIAREIYETHNIADDLVAHRTASPDGIGLWGQLVGRSANRDTVSASDTAYDGEAYGFTIGADIAVGENLLAGLVFTYAYIEVDEEAGALEETEIDSFSISGYVGGRWDRIYANASIGYSFNDAETVRNTAFGSAFSDFDLDGVRAQAFAGYDFGGERFEIAPFVGLRYAELSADTYAETGLLNLLVDAEDVDFFEGRIGMQGGTREAEGFGFRGRATYVYDFDDDLQRVDIGIPGTSGFTAFAGERPESRFEIAGGVTFAKEDRFTFALEYQGEFASDYDSHAGVLSARYAF